MAKIANLQEVATSELVPYERNAKIHGKDQIEKLKASIEAFGFLTPCLIDRQKNIIAGHGRVMAAKELGLRTVPCVMIEDLTDEQRRAYILADNRLSELGEWNMETVQEELKALEQADFDIDILGFDWDSAAALEPITEPFQNAEEVLEPIGEKPDDLRTKPGDLWKLGDHRLLCGDSTSAEDMDRLFDGELADLVFTDPPYGVAIGSKNAAINAIDPGRGGRVEVDIEADTLNPDELYEVLVRAFSRLRERCASDCSYYVTTPPGGQLGMMMMMMRDAGLMVRHQLAWIKSSPTFSMGRLDYDYRHEAIFYTWTERHHFYGGYDNTVIDDNQKLEALSKEELKELVHALKKDGSTSAIYCDKPTHCDLHPTMKPLKLIQRFVHNSSKPGDIVADIFGGSGSTIIVCEKMRRRCFTMEIDPHYCDVIVERWEQFTGRKAEKVNV